MSIKAVFRVQCDGPCKGWLSRTEDYVPGTEALPEHNEVLPTAERAWLWPGERAARNAALRAGWRFSHDRSIPPPYKIYCPNCKENPLGIQFPPDRGKVAALIRAQKKPSYISGTICVDPRCPAGKAHYGPCPQPYNGCLTHIAGACDGSTRDCVTQKCGARTPSGAFPCTRPQGHDDEHRNGTLDWF